MPQLLDYLHAVAREAGRAESETTTSTGTTSTLVSSALVNSIRSSGEYANWWVLPEGGAVAGQQGQLSNAPLAPTTGTLTTATTFSDAVASGVTFGLYARDRLPPLAADAGRPSWRGTINRALRMLWIERNLSLTGVSGQKRYALDLVTYPWLTDEDRIIEVRYPTSTSDDVTEPLDRADWWLEQDGQTRQLVIPSAPFNTGQTATLKCYAPANSLLKLDATARATVVAGSVTAVTIVHGGAYTVTPTVSITGGGGTGATAQVNAADGLALTGVGVPNGGSGYTSAPTVSFVRVAPDDGWTNQTSPLAELATITDEAVSDLIDVKTVALHLGYRELATLGAPGQTKAEWLAMAQQWGDEAKSLEHFAEPSSRRTNVATLRPVLVRPSSLPRLLGRRPW